jgi:hypothetical protein
MSKRLGAVERILGAPAASSRPAGLPPHPLWLFPNPGNEESS